MVNASNTESSQAQLTCINYLLKKYLPKKGGLVLFVDDMERAEPEVVRKLFPVLDQLRSLRHCTLIFAIDRERIAKAFGENQENMAETKGYLDKVFDIQLTLTLPEQNDILSLCESWVDEEKTPKLAKHLPLLKEILPTNPRQARRFIIDAQTQEILFLSRWSDKEQHPFLFFFTLRMLEGEFPNLSQFLLDVMLKKNTVQEEDQNLKDKIDSYLNQIHPSEGSGEGESSKTLLALIQSIQAAQKFSDSQLERFAQLVCYLTAPELYANEFIDSRRYIEKHFFQKKMPWVMRDYSMLTDISEEECVNLEEAWHRAEGEKSLETLLRESNPCKPFKEEMRSVRQFLSWYFSAIFKLWKEYSKEKKAAQHTLLAKRIERLREHLKEAINNEWEFDKQVLGTFKNQKGNYCFYDWAAVILKNLNAKDRILSEWVDLYEQVHAFHCELTKLLPLKYCLMFFKSDATNLLPLTTLEEDYKQHTKEHLKSLRKAIAPRVKEYIFELFQKDPDEDPVSQLENGLENELGKWSYIWGTPFWYCYLDQFLWYDDEDGKKEGELSPLEELAEEAQVSENIATNFSLIVFRYFLDLVESLNAHRLTDKQLKYYFEKRADYLKILWKGATSPKVRKKAREALIKAREAEEAKQKEMEEKIAQASDEEKEALGRSFISPELLEEVFPKSDLVGS